MKINIFYEYVNIYQTINDLFLLNKLFVLNITITIVF